MSELKARPLREEEITKMNDAVGGVLVALVTWREKMPIDGDMYKMLDSAINIINDLREQWLLYVGTPEVINNKTLDRMAEHIAFLIYKDLKVRLLQGGL